MPGERWVREWPSRVLETRFSDPPCATHSGKGPSRTRKLRKKSCFNLLRLRFYGRSVAKMPFLGEKPPCGVMIAGKRCRKTSDTPEQMRAEAERFFKVP